MEMSKSVTCSRTPSIVVEDGSPSAKEHQATIDWVEADSEFLSILKSRLAFIREAWIKRAATRGVDGKAAITYFTSQMK